MRQRAQRSRRARCAFGQARGRVQVSDQARQQLDEGRPERSCANTAALLRRLPDSAFGKTGRHTVIGVYTDADWFRIYAEHLEVHARQIERNMAAWEASRAT